MNRVDASDSDRARALLEGIDRLPTLPSIVAQVYETASDPDTSALDLARHFTADQSLSAALLRLVNSAYYGFQRKITNITDAVVILGFVQVRDLALAATAFKAFPETRTTFDRTQLWRHSLAVAITADRLARRVDLAPSAAYFSVGLLHDIGKVALDLVFPQPYMAAIRSAHERNELIGVVEDEVFGIHHGEAGAHLAKHWNLPNAFRTGARYHHDPEGCLPESGVPSIIALADHVAYLAGMGESSNGRQPPQPSLTIAHHTLDESSLASLVRDIAETRDQIDALLGVLHE